jgi:hypothetical protein
MKQKNNEVIVHYMIWHMAKFDTTWEVLSDGTIRLTMEILKL